MLYLDIVPCFVRPVCCNNRTVQHGAYSAVVLYRYVDEWMAFGRVVPFRYHTLDRRKEDETFKSGFGSGRMEVVFLYGVDLLSQDRVCAVLHGCCRHLGSLYAAVGEEAVQRKRLLSGYDPSYIGELQGHDAHPCLQRIHHDGIFDGFALGGIRRVSRQNPLYGSECDQAECDDADEDNGTCQGKYGSMLCPADDEPEVVGVVIKYGKQVFPVGLLFVSLFFRTYFIIDYICRMNRIIGIDYGTKRIGLAVSDPLGMFASPLDTVHPAKIIEYLKNYAAGEGISMFVVGYPMNMDNTPAAAARFVDGFLRRLAKDFPDIPVELEDERFTSVLAHRAMIDGGMKKMDRRDKAVVDKISAAIILQSYLDRKK